MPGTRRPAVTGALTVAVLTRAVLATVVLATVVLTAGVTGPALLPPAAAATAGGARGGGHGGAGTPGMSTVGAAIRARLPLVATLDAVSCPSARLCMTVGTTASHDAVVLRWNGTSWADVSVPRPATASLFAIWCGSATSCLAVGDTRLNASGSKSTPLAEEWNGHAWTVLPVPSPAHAVGFTLTDIDCASATTCTAVGSYTTAKGGDNPPAYALAEGWNGTAWRLEPIAAPAAKATTLSSVSCPPAGACTTVGSSNDGGLVAERWNGKAWAGQHTEPSGGAGPGDFSAVSCPSASSCTAVGDSGGDDNQGLTETWNGRTWWGSQGIVAPSDWSTLSGVACFSGTKCLAVGSDDGVRGDVTLAARLHGSTWSVQRTPNVPRPALDSKLAAVSCASATACLAVGGSDRACCTAGGYSRDDRALAEWWNGTKWRLLPTPSGR